MKWLRMPIEHIPQLTVSWCYIYHCSINNEYIEICLCVDLQHRVRSHDHVQEDECGRMYAAVIDLEFAVDAGVVEADTAAGVVDAEREGEHRIRPVLRVHGNVAVDDIDVEVIGAGDHVEGVHGGHDDDHRHGGGHSVA